MSENFNVVEANHTALNDKTKSSTMQIITDNHKCSDCKVGEVGLKVMKLIFPSTVLDPTADL